MCDEEGINVLKERFLRPHMYRGDALIFDCRILHFGLANQTEPIVPLNLDEDIRNSGKSNEIHEETVSYDVSRDLNLNDQHSQSAIRPLLYINYTQPWFVDPKNWNDNEKLFD